MIDMAMRGRYIKLIDALVEAGFEAEEYGLTEGQLPTLVTLRLGMRTTLGVEQLVQVATGQSKKRAEDYLTAVLDQAVTEMRAGWSRASNKAWHALQEFCEEEE